MTFRDLITQTGIAACGASNGQALSALELIPRLLRHLYVETGDPLFEALAKLWETELANSSIPTADRLSLINLSRLISSEIPAKGVAAVQLDETTIRVIRRDNIIDGEMMSTLEECLLGDRNFKRTFRGAP